MPTDTLSHKLATDGRQPVRIRYSKGETGWAFKLPDGRYQINNLPLEGNLNIDDIVECREESNELPIVNKVITEGYPVKSAVAYQTVEQYKEFCKLARGRGCKTEGLISPNGKSDGIVIVAHQYDFDPFKEAEGLGIKDADVHHRPKRKKK